MSAETEMTDQRLIYSSLQKTEALHEHQFRKARIPFQKSAAPAIKEGQ